MGVGSQFRASLRRGLTALIVGGAMIGLPLVAGAQNAQQLEWIQEIEQLQQRIDRVQSQAVERNPQLVESARAIEETMIAKMESAGHRPQDDLATLERAEQRLQDPSLSDAQRREIVASAEVTQAQRNLQAAMSAISADPELATMQDRFEADLLEKMKAIDPEIEQAYERGVRLQQQLINSMQ
ncbi:MAG: hypothetical protein ACK4IT_06830 [Thioalkalivibrionaceae bacterium]